MNFDHCFPLKLWTNLGRHHCRRSETEARLDEAGVRAERFPGVDLSHLADRPDRRPPAVTGRRTAEIVRKGMCLEAYGRALTLRLAIREARKRRAPAVLLFDDSIAIHPNFSVLISSLCIPDNWGLFYLGCTHLEPPEWISPRVTRVNSAIHSHAMAVRANCYGHVMKALALCSRAGQDVPGVLDALHKEIPTYACYPNLVWQDPVSEDPQEDGRRNYTHDGKQTKNIEAVENLLDDLVSNRSSVRILKQTEGEIGDGDDGDHQTESRLALLFLTREDVNHPEIWRQFVAEAPDRVSIFSHVKAPERLGEGFLKGTIIDEYFHTAWGDISLVKASRALLLKGLEDKSLTHFVLLSESCVPIVPLPQVLKRLDVDPRSQFNYRLRTEVSARQAPRVCGVPSLPVGCWRFSPQWWLMNRAAAAFSAGKDFCDLFERMIIPDEAYFSTVLVTQGFPLDGEVVKRDVTWTHWEKDAGSPNSWQKLPREILQDMVQSGAFFARKFPKGADIGRFQLHRSPPVDRNKSGEERT